MNANTKVGWVARAIVPQRDKPTTLDGPIPWVRIEDFEGKFISSSKSGQGVTATQVTEMPLRVFPRGTVVTSCSCTMGATAIAANELITNQTFIGLVPDPEKLAGDFLYYYLQGIQQTLQANASGSIQQYLSKDEFQNLRLWLPSLDEQRRIAGFLDDRVSRIDNMIAARGQQLDAVRLHRSIAIADCVADHERRFGTAPLRRFSGGIEQGASPVADSVPAEAGQSGVLMTSAIQRGVFWQDRNKLVADAEELNQAHLIRSGDLLVTRGSGSAALVGDVAVAILDDKSPSLYLSDLTYRIKRPTMSTNYLTACLLTPRVRAELANFVRQGTGPAKARGDDILSLTVPAAPREAQEVLVELVARLDQEHSRAVEVLEISVDLLTEYKQSLISAAVTGELDVTTASTKVPA